ncbi:MAG: sterol desaturase family protein, partial [Bdellovibrionales bacterium]|nr:sterol desaturase family protein [Oligoflexia bacterium]
MFIFLSLTLLMFVGVLLRYFVLAGVAYWTCWIFKCEALQTRRIDGGMTESRQLPKFRAQMQSEIFYSILACAIFALAGSGIYIAWKLGWTKVYLDISQYGWGYFFLSFWIAAFFHETYFYWTHRWMHGVRVFRKVHKVHHDSKSPTPWAAFSFHP